MNIVALSVFAAFCNTWSRQKWNCKSPNPCCWQSALSIFFKDKFLSLHPKFLWSPNSDLSKRECLCAPSIFCAWNKSAMSYTTFFTKKAAFHQILSIRLSWEPVFRLSICGGAIVEEESDVSIGQKVLTWHLTNKKGKAKARAVLLFGKLFVPL